MFISVEISSTEFSSAYLHVSWALQGLLLHQHKNALIHTNKERNYTPRTVWGNCECITDIFMTTVLIWWWWWRRRWYVSCFSYGYGILALIWGKMLHEDIRYIVDIFTPWKKLEWHSVSVCSECYIWDGSTEAESKRDTFVQIVIGTRYWNNLHSQLNYGREEKIPKCFYGIMFISTRNGYTAYC